jgi:hypothetical protein
MVLQHGANPSIALWFKTGDGPTIETANAFLARQHAGAKPNVPRWILQHAVYHLQIEVLIVDDVWIVQEPGENGAVVAK